MAALDNSAIYKTNESKTTICSIQHNWKHLPHHILKSIFQYTGKDAFEVSKTCRSWRRVIYSCRSLWKKLIIDASTYSVSNQDFVSIPPLMLCENFILKFNPQISENITQACDVLLDLKFNRNLRNITLQPTSSYMEWFNFSVPCCKQNWLKEESFVTVRDFCTSLVEVIESAGNLEHLSWGLTDGFDGWQNFILESLRRYQVHCLRSLHMATLRSDPLSNNSMAFVDRSLVASFCLTRLSLDFVHVSEDLLMELSRHSENLSQLSIFVQQWQQDAPYVRNQVWRHVAHSFPRLAVTLNMVHADSSLPFLTSRILQPSMPLHSLRVYCSGGLCPEDILFLSSNFPDTLRSVHIVDALLEDHQPNYYRCPDDLNPDPFVMLAWRCKLIQEIVIIGYWVNISDLRALSALRGPALKILGVPQSCIHYDECKDIAISQEFIDEISGNLGYCWKAMTDNDLDQSLLSSDWDTNTENVYLPLFLSEQEPMN